MAAFMFLLFFSWETSPLSGFTSKDSSIFRLTGQLWDKGRIPYKQFFDHKGPFIFFVQWLACQITYDKLGVFAVQIVCLLCTLCGIYRIFRLLLKEKASMIWTIASLFIINIYFDGGNLTEEYCLPLITWSLYYIFKCIYKEIEYQQKYYFLSGITFAVCSLTRVTNFMPVFIALMTLIFFEERNYKKIVKSAISFFIGAIVITLPFVIYFYAHGALYEMLYGTILYNVKNIFYVTGGSYSVSIIEHIKMLVYSVPLILVLIVSIFYVKKNKRLSISLLLMSGVSIIMAFVLRPYPHYLVVWIPMIAMGISILCNTRDMVRGKWHMAAMCLMSIIVILGKNALLIKENYEKHTGNYMEVYEREAKEIDSMIPDSAKNAVVAYNVEATYYLVTGKVPCYKYCFLQDLQGVVDKRMRMEFEEEIKSCKAKYIITRKNRRNRLDMLLRRNYEIVGENNLFVVNKRAK